MSLRYVTRKEYQKLASLATYFEELMVGTKVSFKQTNNGWKIHISSSKYDFYHEFDDADIMYTPPMEIISKVSKLIIAKL